MNIQPSIGKKVKVRKAEKGAGFGLFAEEQIKKGDYIIDYVGEIIPNAKCENHPGKYLFEVDDHFTIDGAARENIARYINHSCKPNSEVEIEKGEIKIYAIKDIAKGEEINYDYGKEYFNEFIKPIGCKCTSCMKKIKTT
jgi:SET domain-containing protein